TSRIASAFSSRVGSRNRGRLSSSSPTPSASAPSNSYGRSGMPTEPPLTLADILAAQQVIRGIADDTPLVPSPFMAARTGHDFLLKLENMQPMGAFKLRGAVNAVAALPAEVAGVVCCSTGNHGRAVAYAARARRLRAVVCMSGLVPGA